MMAENTCYAMLGDNNKEFDDGSPMRESHTPEMVAPPSVASACKATMRRHSLHTSFASWMPLSRSDALTLMRAT